MTRLLTGSVLAFLAGGCASAPPPPAEPTSEDKLARILKLEDERSPGDGELLARLGDPDGRVRARAAVALARTGAVSGSRLVPLLDDPSPYVRATTAFALGIQEAPLSSEVEAALVEALTDEEPRVRGRAAQSLGLKGASGSAEAIGVALAKRAPRGGEPYEWTEPITDTSLIPPHVDARLALFALARLGSLRFAWDALATEGGTPRFVWWPAAHTASELEGDELQSIHLFYAGSPDPTLRLYGARGLSRLSADRSRDHVRQLLFDPNEKVRIEAIRAATRLRIVDVVPDLLSHLGADTRYVQVEVLKALAVLPSPAAVEPLIDRLGDDSAWVRSLALGALAHQDPDSFWLLLSGIGSDREWRARRALAELLRTLPGERPRTLLRQMVADPDGRVRAAALEALGALDPGATELLIRHLRGSDPFERVAAARALAAAGARQALAPLEQAFVVEKDEDPRVRVFLLEAVFAIDPRAAEPLARRALDDTSFLVRRRAAALLAARGSDDVTVRPRSSEAAVSDYLALLRAPYTPQAFVRTSRGRVELELFINDAPQTVQNFVRLARQGFFDGLPFHDVVPNGRVAGGDPRGDGNGGPGYTIPSEPNERPVVRGTVAMEEEGRDTAGSRFFITHLPDPGLEGIVTVFGHVVRGMEVVDQIEPGDVIEEVTIWDGVVSPYERP
jgi:cyclophilin family peptidyl-prolyl cis-trans isomerase/HEAT repeat protein